MSEALVWWQGATDLPVGRSAESCPAERNKPATLMVGSGQTSSRLHTLARGTTGLASSSPRTQLTARIASFVGVVRHEGRRVVGPPAPELLAQAQRGLDRLWELGVEPYRAVLGADATVALFIMAEGRHAEIEFLGPERGVVLELERLGEGEPEYEEHAGDGAVEQAAARLAEFLGKGGPERAGT